MAFLATTALTEFWDERDGLLLLGSWCLRFDRRQRWERFRYTVMPSPWDDRQRFYAAARYLDDYGETVLGLLGDYLNSVHGASHGRRYWRILLGPWLMHFLHSVYDRYVHLRDALERWPDARTVLLAHEAFRVPRDTVEAIEFLCDDPYNLQIISQLLQVMGYNFPERLEECEWGSWSVLGRRTGMSRYLDRVKTATIDRLNRAAGLLHRGIVPVGLYNIGFGPWTVLDVALRTRLRAVPVKVPGGWSFEIPRANFDKRRMGLGSLGGKAEFERSFVRLLPQALPSLYLEGYHPARKEIQGRQRLVPKVIVSGTDWYFNEPFKYGAAEASEKGSRLVAVQHGGGYGTLRFMGAELHESRLSDVFRVWGWANAESSSVRNAPSPKLSVLLKGRQLKSGYPRAENILLMTTAHPRYLYRFHSAPVGSQWNEYYEWQLRFLRSIPGGLQSRVVFRPYPIDYGHGVRQRISREFPNIGWDTGRSSYKRLERARIVVIDHNSTSHLETLVGNIPTVMFWNPKCWEERTEAAPYLDDLRKVGILFNSPEEAAARVSAVYNDLFSWWNNVKVQQVRQAFADRYALARKNWRSQWVGILDDELTAGKSEAVANIV